MTLKKINNIIIPLARDNENNFGGPAKVSYEAVYREDENNDDIVEFYSLSMLLRTTEKEVWRYS
jgi:hypothetical protein